MMVGWTILLAIATGLGFALAGVMWLQVQKAKQRLALADAGAADQSARQRALEALSDGGFIAWLPDGTIWSRGLATLFDISPDTVTSLEDLSPFLAEDEYSALVEITTLLRQEGMSFRLELRPGDGERIIEAKGQPGDEDGIFTAIVWLRDIGAPVYEARAAQQRTATTLDETSRQLDGYTALLADLPVPVYRRGPDLVMDWCNEAYATLVNSTVKEVIASKGFEIETPLMPNQAQTLAEAVRGGGESVSESRHFVVGGQRRTLDVTEVPGAVSENIIGFVRDITHIEEADVELSRHIDAHAEVLNNLSTAISIFGPDKRLDYFNNAFAELWQMDEDWLHRGPTHGEVLDELRENRRIPEQADFPAYKQGFMRLYNDLLETREDVIYAPDGRVLRQVISPHPFGGLFFLAEDITDALVLERSYNTLIAVQQETLDNLYEGVAVYGGDGRLKLANSAFARIWGLDENQLQGEPHISEVVEAVRGNLVSTRDWSEIRDILIAQATVRENISGRMRRRGDVVIDFASVALPDGNALFTYVDVTDSVNVEHALLQRNEALEAADRLKSEFLANVSYELRTPLNVIIGFTEVLGNEFFGDLNDRQKEYTADILHSSNQLLELINNILDLASVEAGQLDLELRRFDVHEVLENVMALAYEPATKQKLEMVLDCPVDFGVIEGDERRIKQVLYRLLSNALKFSNTGGKIVIAAAYHGDDVALSIADNGVGISDADQEVVFETFRRAAPPDRQRSVGLGLSLVKSFVELHGGRVQLDSTLGEGTKVTCFLLPRQGEGKSAAGDGD
ncbi:MAG: PAS domain-containing protein [Rhodospirillaceae bacterium]|nr:PAS domain-containing protein [Rhodospirillaceae bacterium]MBT7760376.1 PAS domain-containing protein [Rhodospirillaceae bacterium]